MLRQLVELIPAYLVPQLAREHGVDAHARTFSPWSHVVALLYAQLTHALSLNDVCDGLRLWATPLRALRGATPPSRDALSHANKIRDCALAEQLFWRVLAQLQNSFPRFRQGTTRGLAWRFRRTIHVVDATVIQLITSCLDWARHNRRKAAAKVHLRLSLRSLLPQCVVVGSAREGDLARSRQLCAGLQPGEIVIFDRGYQWFAHFWELTQRGVFFVTRGGVSSRGTSGRRGRAWAHSFARLFTLLRAGLWQRRDLAQLLRRYGTADGHFAWLAPTRQSWLPGFAR